MLEGASMESMTLKGAAEHLNISKNRIWRAVKDGHLAAEEGKVKGQTAFLVTPSDLESWAQEWLSPEELETAAKHSEIPSKHPEAPPEHLEVPVRHLETPHGYLKVFEGVYEAPEGASSRSEAVWGDSSLREDLVGALERSHQELRQVERRAIELELQLRQHKMLLTENAESLLEREALVKEAEAKLQAAETDRQTEIERLATELRQTQQREAELKASEEARRTEAQRLSAELEATRHQLLEAQKPRGLFSWLGLRKQRTAPASTDKAV